MKNATTQLKTGYPPFDMGTEWLSPEEREIYLRTLANVARTAIKARCGELRIMDLEILAALDEKNNANFEEWLAR